MTPDDARDEIARTARALRELLEREDALGTAELLVRSARKTRAVEPTAMSTPAGAPDRHADQPQPVVSEDPQWTTVPGPAVDLFGNAIVSPAPAEDVQLAASESVAVMDHAVVDLNPRGLDPRARLHEASLPVIEELATTIRACRLCGLCESRTQAVPGVGSAQSGIVFVGEAPGADEDARGEPFVGRAGQLLTRIIQAVHEAGLVPGVPLSRDTVFICNVLKCRPPENRNPLPHEIEQCSPYLIRQLESLQPRVICCLGKFAAELLLGVKGTIAALRGKVYRYQGSKLIVTYHPAACLRNATLKRPVWEDMQLLAREYLTD